MNCGIGFLIGRGFNTRETYSPTNTYENPTPPWHPLLSLRVATLKVDARMVAGTQTTNHRHRYAQRLSLSCFLSPYMLPAACAFRLAS